MSVKISHYNSYNVHDNLYEIIFWYKVLCGNGCRLKEGQTRIMNIN